MERNMKLHTSLLKWFILSVDELQKNTFYSTLYLIFSTLLKAYNKLQSVYIVNLRKLVHKLVETDFYTHVTLSV
ncbi:hypothetical protein DJ530_12905, partial [Sulfolobus sp. E1]